MSYRKEKIMSLVGLDVFEATSEKLRRVFHEILNNGIHGICFSPYMEGQSPGSIITKEQIKAKLRVISPYTKWIRTFSCTDGNEMIPKIAKQMGLKTFVGAWLGKDTDINEKEIENAIQLAKLGQVDMLAIGNEVLYRQDLSLDELLNYILRVKKEVPKLPVGYVDAYYEFANRPALVEACDIIFANCYPFWEGCPLKYSLLYMKDMYHRAVKAANGKKVVISETGWPNRGSAFGESEPSFENALKYFINAHLWSTEDHIEMFYFSSFDEPWKINSEGDVGAYWGLWDKDDHIKY